MGLQHARHGDRLLAETLNTCGYCRRCAIRFRCRADILQRSGAVVTAVASAEEALDVLQRERPDVLLTDLSLPGRGGSDSTHAVVGPRRRYPRRGAYCLHRCRTPRERGLRVPVPRGEGCRRSRARRRCGHPGLEGAAEWTGGGVKSRQRFERSFSDSGRARLDISVADDARSKEGEETSGARTHDDHGHLTDARRPSGRDADRRQHRNSCGVCRLHRPNHRPAVVAAQRRAAPAHRRTESGQHTRRLRHLPEAASRTPKGVRSTMRFASGGQRATLFAAVIVFATSNIAYPQRPNADDIAAYNVEAQRAVTRARPRETRLNRTPRTTAGR